LAINTSPVYCERMSKDEFLSVGGQAIVEGVMMRSPKYFAVACRAPNKELIVQAEPIEKTWIGRQKWLKLPFLRGSWALLDAMALGTRAMKFASNVQLAPEYQPVDAAAVAKIEQELGTPTVTKETVIEKEVSSAKKIQEGVVAVTMIISLVFAIVMFKGIPQFLGTYLREQRHFGDIKTNAIIETIHEPNIRRSTLGKPIFHSRWTIAEPRLACIRDVAPALRSSSSFSNFLSLPLFRVSERDMDS
jgi:uncharacterized protein YqhQ